MGAFGLPITHFNNFYSLLQDCFVGIYDYDMQMFEAIESGKHPKDMKDEIVFNRFFTSANEFRMHLEEHFDKMINELEKEAAKFETKAEYLFYLKEKNRRIQDLKDEFIVENNCIKHRGFHVNRRDCLSSKLPKEKQGIENYFEYITLQYRFLLKSIAFLADLILTTTQLPSADMPLKQAGKIKPNAPSVNKPFAFFEYLILKRGLAELRIAFVPQEVDHMYFDGKIRYYDEEDKIIYIPYDDEGRQLDEVIEYFHETLKKRLLEEFTNCLYVIDEKIDSVINSKDEISNYLNVQLPRLKIILDAVDSYPYAKKYEDIVNALYALVKHIFKRYDLFINENIKSLFAQILIKTSGFKVKTLDEIRNCENKFLKGMPMDKIIAHFKPLTEKKSKNGSPFLTNDQLILFMRRGFLNEISLPKQKFNLSGAEKGFVIKRFYQFFDYAVANYNELNKKEKYIRLLADNFDNWKYETIPPFFKRNKVQGDW